MSVTHQVTIWCDRCPKWEQASLTAASLRKELRRRGWKRVGREDLCPNCQPKTEAA